uniref:Amino_oxidase domain-containing protein n=1 Tax=Rhabditophanes sp. KR3021 TaxID=114890 RepID=A0AC35TZU0_9BILA
MILITLNRINAITTTSHNNNIHESVVIIGAGFAGIAAFNHLKKNGYTNVKLVEGSNRIGGRVFPFQYEDGYLQFGAQFINGHNNPIYKMAHQLNLIFGEEMDDGLVYEGGYHFGKCQVPNSDLLKFTNFSKHLEKKYGNLAKDKANKHLTVGQLFQKDFNAFLLSEAFDEGTSNKHNFFEGLANVYKSYFETEWASPINRLALQNLDQWDDEEGEMKSYTLDKFGYQKILEHISLNISADDIYLNSKVINVDYSGTTKTQISLSNGVILEEIDKVISTIPLGHLKKYANSLFTPPLPKQKLSAIKRLGFGDMQKIFLIYEKPFWTDNADLIHAISLDGCTKTDVFSNIFQTFGPLHWKNKHILVGWISGTGPSLLGQIDDAVIAQKCTEHFRIAFNNQLIPFPDSVIRKSWSTDDLFLGSYSFLTPESTNLPKDPYLIMETPIIKDKKLRIQFAGEATHSKMYQTVVGAYLSGQREADRMIRDVE